MTSHIVHLVNDQDVPATALLQLLRRAFGGADSLWPANQRWLYWSDDTLVGHVSVQRRWFLVNQRYWEGWFVGGVCVDPTAQGHGIGTALMRRTNVDLAQQSLPFAVLNCGHSRVAFYERFGYIKIADRALYLRKGATAIDEDPALAISFCQEFDATLLCSDIFPFGFDF